jgi:CubicO group peptidase (beta-lactamase class C family)
MHSKFIFFFVAFVLTGTSQITFGQTREKELTTSIDSILESQVSRNLIPGAVIQIKKDREVIYEKAFGYARKYDRDHRELNPPEKMTTGYMFDIASLTKVVGTTTAIMWLVDKNQLSVDDPVGKYIPAFNSGGKKAITIRHLLTHTAGLYEWYPLYYRAANKQETYKLIEIAIEVSGRYAARIQ